MTPFRILDAVAAPLPLANVDTDKILPARYLKTVSKAHLGSALFAALRYDEDDRPRPDFILNRDPWSRAEILIALENFGCGSSREHAPWALLDFGIRCIIAPSFADIFRANCFKNGILTVVVDPGLVSVLMADAADPGLARMVVDLTGEVIRPTKGAPFSFEVPRREKEALLSGRGEIETSLLSLDQIDRWEASRSYRIPPIPLDVSAGR
jgi:3-isopropylmalate/(R)-2-methylmalate dehydratase small subunit